MTAGTVETEAPAGDDLLFERRGALVVVTLNRPKALNALTHEMALALETRLQRYIGDDDVRAIFVQGVGDRAFCAGGDVRRLYDTGRARARYPYDFYRDEYRLNAMIHHYPKPYIAFIDGIDMGGGVGISVHGSHRVVTERLMLAMPETGIGLFPDVGGSYFLSRLPGQIGLYMAMTGARLCKADAVFAGIGDVFVPSGDRVALIDALATADYGGDARGCVDDVLRRFAQDPGTPAIAGQRKDIDAVFDGATVEDIIARLDARDDAWARETAATMRKKSPTSMKVALRQIRSGVSRDFNACMVMEYRIANAFIAGHDFYEGVRAVVIDKDQAPKWQPASLEGVTEEDVAAYFELVPAGGDLEIPYGPKAQG